MKGFAAYIAFLILRPAVGESRALRIVWNAWKSSESDEHGDGEQSRKKSLKTNPSG